MANGGIIGPTNAPTTSVASGIWTLQEQKLAQEGGIWPIVVVSVDISYLVVAGGGGGGAGGAKRRIVLPAPDTPSTQSP